MARRTAPSRPRPTGRSRAPWMRCCWYRPPRPWKAPRTGSIQCCGYACVLLQVQHRTVHVGLLTTDRFGQDAADPPGRPLAHILATRTIPHQARASAICGSPSWRCRRLRSMTANGPTATTLSSAAEAVALRYVALGDSYTIGTGVRPSERWPDQLCAALGDAAGLELVANLGVNGYTSADLIRHELPSARGAGAGVRIRPDRGQRCRPGNPDGEVRDERRRSSSTRSSSACLPTGSSPSRSPTIRSRPPAPSSAIRASAHAAIVAANAVMAEQSRAREIGWVDILDLSRRAASERSLVASDGLHPVEPSTPCGSSGSCRSWRAGSRADGAARRFARSPERRPGNEAPASPR